MVNERALKTVILLLAGCLISAGCGQKSQSFGDAPSEGAAKTAISSIMLDPQKYIDKEVVVEGTISGECPSGCWLNVRDNSGGVIYVEMAGAPFVPLPQKTGETAVVKGVVYRSENASKEIKLSGKGIVIKPRK